MQDDLEMLQRGHGFVADVESEPAAPTPPANPVYLAVALAAVAALVFGALVAMWIMHGGTVELGLGGAPVLYRELEKIS